MSVSIACPVCDTPMHPLRHDWCFACTTCGFLASNLSPHVGDGQLADIVDEEQREIALVNLRKKNFERILDRIDSLTEPARRSLLEVGCAHGWFLDAAAKRGYDVHGIEPDASIGALASSKGHDVAIGFFGFHHHHHHHFRHFVSFGIGLPYGYADYPYGDCYDVVRVRTYHGWRWRRVYVCG